jgi:hypothetical protein
VTNDEIRIKIAKLHGASWRELDGKAYLCNPQHAALLPKGAKLVDSPAQDSARYYRVKNWPEDIATAWELVEEWRKKGEVDSIIYKTSDLPDFRQMINTVHLRHSDIYAEADTAPLAICLAYIQWRESQK